MSQTIGEMNVGDIVQLREDGVAISYLIVHQGSPNPEKYINADGAWLLRLNADDQVRTYGPTCDFSTSTLVSYLNDGALSKFEASAISAMKTVTIPYEPSNSEVCVGSGGVSCKIFVLNLSEMAVSSANRIANTELDYFNITSDDLAKERRQAFTSEGGTTTCWSRTPSAFTTSVMCWNTSSTTNLGVNTGHSTAYARYAFVIPSDTLVSNNSFVFANSAPTKPGGFQTPSSVIAGGDCCVLWHIATDVDENLEGYELEICVDDGEWYQIYKGGGIYVNSYDVMHTFTAPREGNSFALRVRAYDSLGETSEYNDFMTPIAIIHNTPPRILGSDEILGEFSTSFSQKYSVIDDEGGSLSIDESVDDELINFNSETFSEGVAKEFTFSFTPEQWVKLCNGNHTISLKVKDSYGESAERNYTFSKLETEIHLEYLIPIETNTQVVFGILTVSKYIAEAASFVAEVCNNGFDEEPTWENITAAVNLGGRFYLNNGLKSADKWGFNVRLKVNRENATEDSWISEVSGYFREG